MNKHIRWVAFGCALGIFGGSTSQAASSTTAPAIVRPHPTHVELNVPAVSFPPSTSYCMANFGIHCYQPLQFTKAYNLTPLHSAGIDGSGTTIVIVEAFGSPTIANDLHVFDQQFGLPDPPKLTVLRPAGPIPALDLTNRDMRLWAEETSLDVEYAHVFAPGAEIVLVETPVDETEGVQGFPEMVRAENFVIDHGIGDVISQSFDATEETFPNKEAIFELRSAFENAARHHVTVLGSSGDQGATNGEANLTDLYPMRVIAWPSSDPLVTSIGGTRLMLDDAGTRLAPDVVWNDHFGASGGGVSTVFRRPEFQDRVRTLVGEWRGTPDISMSADDDGAAVVYHSFNPASVGYHLVAGTSEACPEFSGIVAMAVQLAGHRLGNLNEKLYALKRKDLVDITEGNNTFGPFTNSDGAAHTVIGFSALPGYDLASGLGTINAPQFVRALAREGREEGRED
jgi:subtilase family serine protease